MQEAVQTAAVANTGIFATIREALSGAHRDLTQGNLRRTIIILAIPMILEMLMESLFGIVDMFFVARLGVDSLATVALTESCLVLVFGIAMGLSMATTAFVARRIGEKDPAGAAVAAVQAIAVGLLLSLIVAAAGIFYAPNLLGIMGASPSVILIGATYTRILLGGSVTIFLLFLINAIFRGAGDPALAMRALWFANIINIVLDPCLINGWGPFPKLNVMGASVATTTGRGLGVAFQLWMLFGGKCRIRLFTHQIRIDTAVLWRLLRVSFTGILQFLIATASWTGLCADLRKLRQLIGGGIHRGHQDFHVRDSAGVGLVQLGRDAGGTESWSEAAGQGGKSRLPDRMLRHGIYGLDRRGFSGIRPAAGGVLYARSGCPGRCGRLPAFYQRRQYLLRLGNGFGAGIQRRGRYAHAFDDQLLLLLVLPDPARVGSGGDAALGTARGLHGHPRGGDGNDDRVADSVSPWSVEAQDDLGCSHGQDKLVSSPMHPVSIATGTPVPHANAKLVDVAALERELHAQLEGEVRFDAVSRALYSTDASVYQITPLGVVVAKSREDLIRIVRIATEFRCPITIRGGGTAQAGQSIGAGLQVDTSKYYNRILELNVAERWVRVEPGIVLDELNAQLKPHGLRFAPDVSTASRAAIGGMMANNSSGARSVLYGKTIDHVISQEVVLADGSVAGFGPLTAVELHAAMQGETQEAECYRTVSRVAAECADEVERRFPKVIRRVGGYNLDEFVDPNRPFNLAKMMVGSEGTLGVVLEAKLNLVALPNAKAVLVVQFKELLEALGATPLILRHKPSAVEVMDKFLLDHTSLSPNLQRVRETFIEGDPGAILCIEFYDDAAANLPSRLAACEDDLVRNGLGYRYFHALEPSVQARVWNLREAALGLSMTMKEDSKSLSFVEDTAVAPEKLRDYIERFLATHSQAQHDGRRVCPRLGRMPPRASGHQHEDRRWRSQIRSHRDGGGGSGPRIRRCAFRRARRRAGAQPLHAKDVRAGPLRGLSHHQAHLRSPRNLQSRQNRR